MIKLKETPVYSFSMLPLAALLSSLALVAARPGPSGHKLDGAQFGSKSSYFSVANTDDSSLEVKINESFNVLKY